MPATAPAPCLSEDELLELAGGGALAAAPTIEAHLADCPSCSAVLAALLAGDQRAAGVPPPRWGALAGRTLGPYRLEAQIGAGAMGQVYRAIDERLRREVAVKVLAPGAAEQARRLEIEARAAAAITHPNVVAVYDVGRAEPGDGAAALSYVVSELVDGESLRSRLERCRLGRGALERGEALRLCRELARGLAAAHARGVIHRDLKPENLILTAEGTLKILDFGLAKLGGDDAADVEATAPGTVFGTAGYMAPEQARGEPANARSDLFAAGAIFYELATGRRAFAGATHAERLAAVLRDTPPIDPAELGTLAPVIARCLEKDSRRRFQSAQDLAWLLEPDSAGAVATAPSLAPGAQPVPVPVPVPAPVPAPAPAPVPAPVPAPGTTTPVSAPVPTAGAVAPAARRPGVSRRGFAAGLAAAAGAGVVAGWRLSRPRSTRAAPPTFRQLTYRQGRVASARLAPDGGTVLFGAAWDTAPLRSFALRLDTGAATALSLPPATVLAVSRRGELALALDQRFIAGQSARGRLATVPLAGGVPHPLADDVQEVDFTPDGRELAVLRPGGRGFVLELPLGTVLLDEPGWLTSVRVSPDGRHVACARHPSPDDDRGELVVVERASGRVRVLASGWDSIGGVAWDPDGRRALFTAAGRGMNSAVHAATLSGEVELVAQSTGRLRLHDVASDGRLLVTLDTWRLRTQVGEVPGRGDSAAAGADRSQSAFSLVTDLSADGRTLLMAELGDVAAENGAYLTPADGGPALRVGEGVPVALSPSGTRVALFEPAAAPALRLVSTTTQAAPRAAVGPIAVVLAGRWLDEDRLVVVGGASGAPPQLWLVTTDGAAPRPLTEPGLAGAVAVERASGRVAFVGPDGGLQVLAPEGGVAQRVAGAFPGYTAVAWTPSGEAVVLRAPGAPVELVGVRPADGSVTPFARLVPPAVGLRGVDAVVLDGALARYALSYGQELSHMFLITLGR